MANTGAIGVLAEVLLNDVSCLCEKSGEYNQTGLSLFPSIDPFNRMEKYFVCSKICSATNNPVVVPTVSVKLKNMYLLSADKFRVNMKRHTCDPSSLLHSLLVAL